MAKSYKKIDDGDLRDLLLNPVLNRRGQYVCDCPFCGKDRHFYISQKTQAWDCKKCGESGNIYKLVVHLDKTYLLAGATVENRDVMMGIREMMEEQKIGMEVELTDLPVRGMPVGWKVSKASTPYLLGRNITPGDCERYKIGATDTLSRFKNYVLIPIYDGGKIRGYIGRYGNKKVPDGKLRYNNSVGTDFSALMFGFDEITTRTHTVILVEGIFDKIAVDKVLELWESEEMKCVCTFGKKISDIQIQKLKIKGVANVILLYDFDAIKEIKKYGLELQDHFVTSITYTTKKDIDECSRSEALEVFTRLFKPRDFNTDVIGVLR